MRVVLADDAVLFREGLARLLTDAGIDVIAQLGDAAALLATVASERPDAAIVDIRMPPTHTAEGLEAASTIRRTQPDVGVLLLSQYVETQHLVELLEAGGGIGYLLKERVTDPAQLIDATRRIAAGESVVDPAVIALLVGRRRNPDPLDVLTAREAEVLALMAEGRSNQALCDKLVLNPKTVETHVRRIFTKLNLPPATDDNRRVLAVLTYLNRAHGHGH